MSTLDALKNLLAWAERNTCTHEDTHRGGTLWEICDYCGQKWADDEGGRPSFEWPAEIVAARNALAQHEAWAATCKSLLQVEQKPVAYQMLRKTPDGEWVDDGRYWISGLPPQVVIADISRRSGWKIRYAYAEPVETGWVNAEDKLPEPGQKILVQRGPGEPVLSGEYCPLTDELGRCVDWLTGESWAVVWWMPAPPTDGGSHDVHA